MRIEKIKKLFSRIPFDSEVIQMASVTLVLVYLFGISMLEEFPSYNTGDSEIFSQALFALYIIPNLFLYYYTISNVLTFWALIAEDKFPKPRKPRTLYPAIMIFICLAVILLGANDISSENPFGNREIVFTIFGVVLYLFSVFMLFRADRDISGVDLSKANDQQSTEIAEKMQ